MTTTKAAPLRSFNGQFQLRDVTIGASFVAADLADAVTRGNELKLSDLFDLSGVEYIDGYVQLTGVFE